ACPRPPAGVPEQGALRFRGPGRDHLVPDELVRLREDQRLLDVDHAGDGHVAIARPEVTALAAEALLERREARILLRLEAQGRREPRELHPDPARSDE